ncbi:MAG TPA: hypothetical protein VLU25_11350 [Acidobacteriota bacterium]|nr:hypothetical protein [Acidobacteriota bacterium]
MSHALCRSLLVVLMTCLTLVSPLIAQNWDEDRSQAEAQYEYIKLLIKNGDFGKVAQATGEFFSIRFPESEEHHFVDTAERISTALTKEEQFEVAHSVLDQALKACRKDHSHGRLFKEKAWVFKKQGNDAEAMVYFEKAKKLLSKDPDR